MRLIQSYNLSLTDPLTIKGQPINIVEDFKYLGSYVGSTERYVKVRIGLAWEAFDKLKSILRSPKVKLNFKIRLFKAACISILLYGCETWILSEYPGPVEVRFGYDKKLDGSTVFFLKCLVLKLPFSTFDFDFVF